MNETKVSDERLAHYARGGDGWTHNDTLSITRELQAHRASRPLEQAVVEAARAYFKAQPFRAAQGAIAADQRGTGSALWDALQRLDAAAKQAGGGEMPQMSEGAAYVDCLRSVSPHVAPEAERDSEWADRTPPAPSSPPREDAMTPEQRAAWILNPLADNDPTAQDSRAESRRHIAGAIRAAVAAEGARKDAEWDRVVTASQVTAAKLANKLVSSEAEVARLKGEVATAVDLVRRLDGITDWQEGAGLFPPVQDFLAKHGAQQPAQPAAGGEARISVGDPRDRLRAALCALSGKMFNLSADHVIDALEAHLDARSSARAGG